MSQDRKATEQKGIKSSLPQRRQPQPGDILDGTYRIDRVLGYGGVGVVCAAWHLHVQRPCAVKYLHPQLVSNPELRARFRREAQSAFQLGHPHIVSITDFRDDPGGWPYIVMELVAGETLRQRLEHGPLPPPLSVRLMIELCHALHTAHRRGVIHRDLKPENLILTHASGGSDDDDIFLKVLDFGLSKILDDADITETGRLLGSPSYMSPEQARGDSHMVDARSDIFSVGALLYECLTAYKLFEAPDFESKRQMIMAASLPPLKLVQRGMPEALETIVKTCCARLPEDRYQTAAALTEALADIYPSDTTMQPLPAMESVRHVTKSMPPSPPSSSSPSPGVPPPSPPVPTAAMVPPIEVVVVPGMVSAADLSPRPAADSAPRDVPSGQISSSSRSERARSERRALTWAVVLFSGITLGGTAALLGYRTLRPSIPAPLQAQPLVVPEIEAPPRKPAGEAMVRRIDPPVPAAPSAKDNPARPQAPRRPAPQDLPRGAESLTMAMVHPVMRRAGPIIVRCFPQHLPPPYELTVKVEVMPSGKVSQASAGITGDPAECIAATLRNQRFPAFRSGQSVDVTYTFVNLQR